MQNSPEQIIKGLKTSEDIINYIKNSTFNSKDMVYRDIQVLEENVHIVYNEAMTSTELISNFVIKSMADLVQEKNKEYKLKNIDNKLNSIKSAEEKKRKLSIEEKISEKKYRLKLDGKIEDIISVLEKNISISKVKKIDLKQDDIFYYLYSGFTCIIYNSEILAVETKGNLDRSIDLAITETTIKGPKDAFNENFQQNIGLIRKRLKSEKLVLEENIIGRRSKTKVGVMYISDIVKMDLVKHVKKKLSKIDIDAILDSNYIMEILETSNKSGFPTMISTERPDLVSFYLLQGRIALIVENSPFILVIPAFIGDFINNIEDYYQKDEDVIITKIVRYIAFFITIFTPAIYIALITFNQEAIPTDLLVSFAAQRKGVPFPAFIEAVLMIVSFEILREGDYRVPSLAGSTLSIVGALILGDAAVSAGIVSPIMIIVIAITTISGLMFTDMNMSNSLRTWRIVALFLSAVSGIIGVGITFLFLVTKLASTTSLTKAFTYPISPVDFTVLNKQFIKRENISTDTMRQKNLTDNLIKYKVKEEK